MLESDQADYSNLFDFGPAVTPDASDEGNGGPDERRLIMSAASPKTELAAAIAATADRLGIDPVDLATAISYETGGRFSTSMMGGKGGNYMGLIQFGPEERAQYGASAGQSPTEQMGAVERYLRDRGLKPGMGLLDLYSTINAGRPGLYDRSDANNGGAPGTVRDKVEKQMGEHRLVAQQMMQDVSPAPAQYTVSQIDTGEPPPQTRFTVRPEGQMLPPITVDAPDERFNANPQALPPTQAQPEIDPAASEKALQALLTSSVDEASAAKKAPASILNPLQGAAATFQQPELAQLPPVDSSSPLPSPPISSDNLPQGLPTVAQKVQPVAPSFIDEVMQQARQAGAGALGTATALPVAMAAAVPAVIAKPARALGFEGPANAAAFLTNEAHRMQQGADFATGANPTPLTPGQSLARAVGRNFVPGSLPITGLMTAADLGSQALAPSAANAKPTIDKPTAEQLLFPQQGLPGPRVTHTIQTAGGPAKVSDGDLTTLGIMGAVTLGAIFAPGVAAAISKNRLPVYRPVTDGPSGLVAASNSVDLARTFDDVNAGIFRVARRVGMDPHTLADIQDKFQIQTGGAARNLINSAITTGKMDTPQFSFQSKVPLAELAKVDSPPVRDYLYARDTFDDILQREAAIARQSKSAQAQQAAAGPVTIRGMTRQDALQAVNAMEAAQPELRDVAAAYQDLVKSMRAYNYKGEFGTISNKEMKRLNQESKNYVPWLSAEGDRQRVLDATNSPERGSPFDALKTEMQNSMRFRMENEATGEYIDAMRNIDPDLYAKVTAQELTDNPNWKKNTVKVYRRGKPEYYVTDPYLADVHNRDPYAIAGSISQGLYATKRLAESAATGTLAPWFAVTSALRSWQIGKLTAGEIRLGGPTAGANGGPPMTVKLKSPTLLGMFDAVDRQMVPQIAKGISESLNGTTGNWLGKVLGPQTVQTMSTKLADVYANSFYAQLEHAGTHRGSFMQHQAMLNSRLQQAIDAAQGPFKGFLTAYKQTLNAIHNSASFDFAYKNRDAGIPLPLLAMKARHLTGDPQIGGQYYKDGRKAIRFQNDGSVAGQVAEKITRAYGVSTELGREYVPWWNITTQGMKRIGEAYLENPAKFVGKAYLYQAMPAAALFLYNRSLGLDPYGMSYSDYQMNHRSEYAKLMNWYIPVPGEPASKGWEIPRFHEMTPLAHMMEVGLDHISRSYAYQQSEDFLRAALSLVGGKDTFPADNGGALFQQSEDAKTVAGSVYEAVLAPPTPPLIGALFGMAGLATPQGVFGGGDAYKKKVDPYDQTGSGLNTQVELVARALGTGMADVLGSGYAAYTQTPKGFLAGVKNGLTEGGKRAIMKTPILRNVTGILPPESGNTRITEELFKKEKVINNLSKFFRTYTKGNDKMGLAPGEINTDLASRGGGNVVKNLLGDNPPSQVAGLNQPPPTNPLYAQFMQEVYNKFNKDSPTIMVDPVTEKPSRKANAIEIPDDEGGIGAKSMWRRYGDYTDNLKRLRNINDGNNVTWQMQLATRPEQLAYLKENHVDPKDLRSVRNFYEEKRQEVAKMILFSIRAVEEDFSRRLGKPFHIEDLDPYAKSQAAGDVLEPQPQIPPWLDGSGIGQ